MVSCNQLKFLVLGETCVDHSNNEGVCKLISECNGLKLVFELYKLKRDYPRHQLLQTDMESCNTSNSSTQFVVCCEDGGIQDKSSSTSVGKACATPNSNASVYSNLPGFCSRKKVFYNVTLSLACVVCCRIHS